MREMFIPNLKEKMCKSAQELRKEISNEINFKGRKSLGIERNTRKEIKEAKNWYNISKKSGYFEQLNQQTKDRLINSSLRTKTIK